MHASPVLFLCGVKDAHALKETLLSFGSGLQHPLSLAEELLSSTKAAGRCLREWLSSTSVSASVLVCDLGGETRAPAPEVPGGPGEHRASRASTASHRLAHWS